MALPKLSASEYLRRVRPGEEVPNRVVNIHPVGDASWRAYVYTIPPGYHPLATGDAAYFATPTRSTRLEAARDLLAHKRCKEAWRNSWVPLKLRDLCARPCLNARAASYAGSEAPRPAPPA